MRRDLAAMVRAQYDVVVVGGGIHGACAAWEAVRRGLRVALIEAVDFGHATSSNSLRTFHGGIRYLQQLDLRRMRDSIRERREWLRLAPHLVRPMRFVLPTTGHGLRGPEVLRAALLANDFVSIDRNVGVPRGRELPRGELWTSERALHALAGAAVNHVNGAAVWEDAICLNTERLQLAVVLAASQAGAHVANYVRALRVMRSADAVCGIWVRDEITRTEFELRARAVINAAGPWVDHLSGTGVLFHASKAFNLVTARLPFADAMGFSCPHGTYFVIPWNGRSLVGTRHIRCDPGTRSAAITPEEVQQFLSDLNACLGIHRLSPADVTGVFAGLLPERPDTSGDDVMLEKTARVVEHSGVFSIVGIKWTTARSVAERAVRMVCERLRHVRTPGVRTLGPTEPRPESVTRARSIGLTLDALEHLVQTYGGAFEPILDLIEQVPALAERIMPDSPVMKAQILHAARAEMVCRLADFVRRRTPLYLSDALDTAELRVCASLIAEELGWDAAERARQIEAAGDELRAFHFGTATYEGVGAECQNLRRSCS